MAPGEIYPFPGELWNNSDITGRPHLQNPVPVTLDETYIFRCPAGFAAPKKDYNGTDDYYFYYVVNFRCYEY